MPKRNLAEPTECPNCQAQVVLVILPDDYCAKRWNCPEIDQYGRVQCPSCKSTFRKTAMENRK